MKATLSAKARRAAAASPPAGGPGAATDAAPVPGPVPGPAAGPVAGPVVEATPAAVTAPVPAVARSSPRIAVIAHSHPRIRAGGGEVAAWRQFDTLRRAGIDAWFLGAVPGDEGRVLGGLTGQITAFDPRDLAVRVQPMGAFGMEQATLEAEDHLLALLERLDADVYHFHHLWNIGAGTIRRLRWRRPQSTFVVTLHELAAICALDGQMVKSTGELCLQAGPMECAACLPGRAPLSVANRRMRILATLELMDVLISPSRFVADRLEDFGVAPGRITVIENGLPDALTDPDSVIPTGAEAELLSRRFAFFGNATPTKGLDVLLGAAEVLAGDASAPALTIEAHGVDAATLARLVPGRTIPRLFVPRGRYRPADAVGLMRRQGWVIVPSTWWENAPVVIDEARAAQRMVIASDIGGMAEKTAEWGINFPVGDAVALARLMATLAGDGPRWSALSAGVPAPTPLRASLAAWAEACGLPPGFADGI